MPNTPVVWTIVSIQVATPVSEWTQPALYADSRRSLDHSLFRRSASGTLGRKVNDIAFSG
jgi:hypothetical protein